MRPPATPLRPPAPGVSRTGRTGPRERTRRCGRPRRRPGAAGELAVDRHAYAPPGAGIESLVAHGCDPGERCEAHVVAPALGRRARALRDAATQARLRVEPIAGAPGLELARRDSLPRPWRALGAGGGQALEAHPGARALTSISARGGDALGLHEPLAALDRGAPSRGPVRGGGDALECGGALAVEQALDLLGADS